MPLSNGKTLFITGATGYIGLVVTEKAIIAGYAVHGLSRTPSGDTKLLSLGATPIRGDLSTLSVLTHAASTASAVLHLAFIHDWTLPYSTVLAADAAAVDALGDGLAGTNKPLVISSGAALVVPDSNGGETDEETPIDMNFTLKDRIESEKHSLLLKERGVRVSVLRLAPYVYGRGGSVFLPWLIQIAYKNGESIYVDSGDVHISTVHVDDAADLYMLAMDHARAGEVFNGTSSTSVTVEKMAQAISNVVAVPFRAVNREEAERDDNWGVFLTTFVMQPCRASSRKAVERLGWRPRGPEFLKDIRSGSYVEFAKGLKK